MKRRLVTALILVGIFFALTALAGLLGWLGTWELLIIAAVAALLTFVIVRGGGRRRSPNSATS